MNERVSRKLSCLQFMCAVMIIALHTTFPRYFDEASDALIQLNRWMRNLDDAAISTFFFLSSYLLFRRADQQTWGRVLWRRLWSLVIPHVLWNALFLAHSLLREYLVMGTLINVPNALEVLKKLTIAPANSIFWYLQTLMGFVVLFPVIRWGVRRKWPAWVCGIAAMIATCIKPLGIAYETMIYWLPVYLLGAMIGYWHRAWFEREPFCSCKGGWAAALAVLGVWAAVRPLGHQVHYLYWIPAPLLMWVLADGFLRLRRHPWWLNASFYLYCVHMIVQHYAVRLYQRTMGGGAVSFALSNVLLPCLCAAMALLGAAAVRAVLPGIYDLFTGKRRYK